jgi:hypothetical protein
MGDDDFAEMGGGSRPLKASDVSLGEMPSPIVETADKEPQTMAGKRGEPSFSTEELEALVVCELIWKNRGMMEVSAFDIIDFLTQTFQKTNYSIAIAELKERGFLERTKDTEPIVVTKEGQDGLRKNQNSLRQILDTIISVHRDRILDSEKLQRLLLLSYISETDAYRFLYIAQQRLTKPEKLLAILLCDRSFQLMPQIEMIAAELRSKAVNTGKARLETLSKDKGFIIAISMLRPQTTFELTGTKLAKIVPFGNFAKNLALVLGPEIANEISEELAKLGIDEKRNIFSFDLDTLLNSPKNRQILTQYYSPIKDETQRLLSADWRLLTNVRELLRKSNQKTISLSEQQIQSLISSKAIFLVKDALLVTRLLLDETENRLKLSEDFLKTKLKDTKAIPLLFWDADLGSRIKNSIIVTVGDFVPNAKVLETNIVLKLSPLELGFEDELGQNQEFNAIGRIDEVNSIKSLFRLAKWENRENHVIVKAAKEIIRGKKFQQFSLQEALVQLQKFDNRIIEILSIACNKATSQQAIEKGHYTPDHLWGDVWRNFHRMHPAVTETEFASFRDKIVETIEKRARKRVISLEPKDLTCSPEITSYLRRRFEERFQKLTEEDKAALYILIKNRSQSPTFMTSSIWPKLFQAQYELAFGHSPKRDALDVLLSLGLLNESIWVTATGVNYGYIAIPSPFLRDIWENLEDRLKGIKPSTRVNFEEFCSKFKESVAELAAVEALICNRGWLTRDQLRTELWILDHEFWHKFEGYPYLISEKERPVIALNTSLIPELERFVLEAKLNVLEKRQTIFKQLRDLPNCDVILEADRNRGIYQGSITLESGKEYSLFVTPWFSRQLLESTAEHTKVVFVTDHKLTLELHNLLRDASNAIMVNTIHEKPTIASEVDDEIIELIVRNFEGYEFTKMVARPITLQSGKEKDFVRSTLEEIKIAKQSEDAVPDRDAKVFAGLNLSDIIFEPVNVDNHGFESLLFAMPVGPFILLTEKTHGEDFASSLKVLLNELHRIKMPAQQNIMLERKHLQLESNEPVILYQGDEQVLRFFDLDSLPSMLTEPGKIRIIRKLHALANCDFRLISFYIGHRAEEALKSVILSRRAELPERFIFLKLKTLEIDSKKKLAERCWGFVRPVVEPTTLDAMFTSARKEYYAKLEEIMADTSLQPYVVMSKDNEEGVSFYESPEHIALKYFILAYFRSVHLPKVEPQEVNVEKPLTAKPQITPDIHIPALNLSVEVETFYGTGATPVPRLSYVLDNYIGVDLKLWIVVPPLQSLLFMKSLSFLAMKYKARVNCRFFTVDVARKRLIGLDESFGESSISTPRKENPDQ